MIYDFDEIIDRRGTGSVKWDGYKKIWGRDDLLPMWVADMDFRTPPFAIEAIQKKLDRGVLGYTCIGDEWYESVASWQKKRNGWEISREDIAFIPGIVHGIGYAEMALTAPGDTILVTSPVYHPFFIVSQKNGRNVKFSPLTLGEDNFNMDFERFSQDIKGCKMFILSNPHNPGGRVWSVEELRKIAEICHENGVIVISDEIHSDMTFPGYKHVPFATVSDKAAEIAITFNSPSKAFNVPGVVSSYAIVVNPELRERFYTFLEATELDTGNIFSYDICTACYENGEEWLNQSLAYIRENVAFTEEYLKANIPGLSMIRPQASFLIFLDARGLGLSHDKLLELFADKAHLALNDGAMFGKAGEGFMRLNVACPRKTLEEALGRLAEAVKSL